MRTDATTRTDATATPTGGVKKRRVAIYGGAFDPPTVDHTRCPTSTASTRHGRWRVVWKATDRALSSIDRPNLFDHSLSKFNGISNQALPGADPALGVRPCPQSKIILEGEKKGEVHPDTMIDRAAQASVDEAPLRIGVR